MARDLRRLESMVDPIGSYQKMLGAKWKIRSEHLQKIEQASYQFCSTLMIPKSEGDRRAISYLEPQLRVQLELLNDLYPSLSSNGQISLNDINSKTNIQLK
jgi:hypothetical protein